MSQLNTVKIKYMSQNSPTTTTYDVPVTSTWGDFLSSREPGVNLSGFVLRVRKPDGEKITPDGADLVWSTTCVLMARKQEGAY